MTLWNETKSVPVSKDQVWLAYKKVRSKAGSAGIDQISMEEYNANRSGHLYKLWNRMASGSYFPPPLKEVEIPKKDGGKNAHQALAEVRKNVRISDWVIDLDIKGFFDNIDHAKLMLALKKHVSERWCLMYIERWLQTPVQTKTGELVMKQGKGTPQGGVISPLLANLFLHYAMDKWLEQTHPTVSYVRYADDAILHCKSKSQADYVMRNLNKRMKQCGLELHPEKTKLVYCRDYRRQGAFENVKFDFLSYSFQPRTARSKKTRELFLGYDCAISTSSKKRIAEKMRELKVETLTHNSIVGVAQFLEPYIRGWINYYGKFRIWEMNPIFQLLRRRLVMWARKRYKRYKTTINGTYAWLERVKEQYPTLFYQWSLGFS